MRSLLIGLTALSLIACGGDSGTSAPRPDAGPGPESDAMVTPDGTITPDMMAPDGQMGRASLSIDRVDVDFGTAGIGSRNQADIVFTNDGEVELQITAFEGLAVPFKVSRSLPIRIPVGASRTLVFNFEPSEVGVFEQMVTVTTDAEDVGGQLTLRGQVESADGRLQTTSLDYGIVVPGESVSDFVIVENLSSATGITITEIAGIMPPFAVAPGQIPAMAGPMEEARALLTFAPEAEGEFSQTVTVRTNAGDFELQLIGRALAPGGLNVRAALPAWGPIDEDVEIRVSGGPFPEGELRILVGEVPLVNPTRVDEERLTGTLLADEAGAVGPQDIRVEIDQSFGLLVGRFIRTLPLAEGTQLSADEVPEEIGPAGNPWRLPGGGIRSDGALTILPGTVIVAGTEAAVTMTGTATIGSRDGFVVFSHERRRGPLDGGGWAGLNFEPGEGQINLFNTTIEYTGSGRIPAIRINNRFVAMEGLTIQAGLADGVQYEGTAAVSLVGASIEDVEYRGIRLDATSTIAQLSRTRIRIRAGGGIPIEASPRTFGRLPIGPEHDWGPDNPGIVLIGATGTTRLSNQPAGVVYSGQQISVGAADTFTLAPNVPFRLTGPLEVSGTLLIPGGGDLEVHRRGEIQVQASGVLSLTANEENRLFFGPVGEADDSWNGLVVDGRIDGGFFTIRRGSLTLNNDFGDLEGVHLEAATGPLTIAGSGNLLTVVHQSDEHPVVVTAGEGRISGTVDVGGELDVRFEDPMRCAAWDLSGLRRTNDEALRTNCQ